MNAKINHTINKILNSLDSDDVLSAALYAESNILKEDRAKLKKMLNELLHENSLTYSEATSVKQFISFFE